MATNYKAAGRITGNPLFGLCERMCIEVRQVFDGCERRESNISAITQFTDFTGGAPYEFVSIRSFGNSTVTDLRTIEGRGCSQVECTINVPLLLTYRDANCNVGTARGTLRINRSVSLQLPSNSLLPFTVEPTVVLFCDNGSFLNADTVSYTYCIVEVLKVIVPADILVPTYGYAVYPDCAECGASCPGILTASLFPTEASPRNRARRTRSSDT